MNEIEEHQATMVNLLDECEELSARLDALIEQFRQLVPGTAAAWIRREFTRGIKDNAERVQELGLQGMRAIKEDMEYLINGLPVTVAELLENRSAWPHYEEELPAHRTVHKEFFLDRIFRDLISTAGSVLERHQLLGNGGSHMYWQRKKSGWRYGVNSSTTLVAPDLYEQYLTGLNQLRELRRRYELERKTVAEARAQALWESV